MPSEAGWFIDGGSLNNFIAPTTIQRLHEAAHKLNSEAENGEVGEGVGQEGYHANTGHADDNDTTTRSNKCTNDSENDRDDTDGKNDENRDGYETHPPKSIAKTTKKNTRFSGTVTLCVNSSLKQELSLLFGLRIQPSQGSSFADCRITLDPITVRASTLFSDDDDDISNAISNHFYITEQVKILIGACDGACDAPVAVHPLHQHFAERRTISTKNSFDVSLEPLQTLNSL